MIDWGNGECKVFNLNDAKARIRRRIAIRDEKLALAKMMADAPKYNFLTH